jgi:glycerol-3-phosphate acyltransferase PlsY
VTRFLGLEIGIVAAAYLLGSVSFATLLVRMFHGLDVREAGSRNAGATNVLRTAGGWLAVFTLLLDIAKGAVAVFAMSLLTADPVWRGVAAVAAIVGHVFPVWFAFRGGKGVATALGAFFLICPWAALAVTAVFGAVVASTRLVSLGSVTAACLLPITMGLLFRARDAEVAAALVTTALLLISHRRNIARLVQGTERRLGETEKPGE